MNNARKRANKRQQELLVERLHNNIEMARGNQADRIVVEFWDVLANELNILGCSRNIKQWQHVWNVWVAKVKTKARKIRDSIRATGGGPAEQDLTDTEKKILDIVGTAAVYGFSNLEAGLPSQDWSPTLNLLPSSQSQPLEAQEPQAILESQVELEPQEEQLPNSGPVRQQHRRRRPRPPRPPVHEGLVRALLESNSSLQDAIRQSASDIADALRESSTATLRAAEVLASAISSSQNHNLNH